MTLTSQQVGVVLCPGVVKNITKLHVHHMQYFSNEIHVIPTYRTRLLNEPHESSIK